MEGSHSEAIFKSLNLSPQLFTNEVLNTVDDLLDEAFDFFLQQLMITDSTDQSAELTRGVTYIRNLTQLTLDQRLQKWEEYCLRFLFHVPDGFSLPEKNELSGDGDDLLDLNALTDAELDMQLESVRKKLTSVEKENAELDRKVRALEKQSLSSNQSSMSIDEALQLYKKHGATQLFQELTGMASEFRAKVHNLKRRRVEENQCDRVHASGDGPFGAELEKLQEFLDEVTTL
ncbi:hypothetical protein PHJA_000146700 [Phtheirospermum japonicum]|uniref:Protein MIS12 homolog n=1 Tax=Phtheirospermum japonicum TaxID=374723 RepID=A0A830B647_9LAMI|nr:hypothetical protein PHJA_000146700 [Phtheirospermum japonicum]